MAREHDDMPSSNKRRRGADGNGEPISVVNVPLSKLLRTIGELETFCKTNQNVHREIKKLVGELKYSGKVVATEDSNMRTVLQETKKTYEEEEQILIHRKEKTKAEIKKLRDTQDGGGTCLKCRSAETKAAIEVDFKRLNIQTYEDFQPLAEKKWTLNSFKKTTLDASDSLKVDADHLVIFCDLEANRRTKWSRRIINRFPEILEVEEYTCEGGKYAQIEQETIYKSKDGTNNKKRKTITVAYFDPTRQDERNKKDVFNILKELKDYIKNNDVQETVVAMALPQGIGTKQTRKILECIFYNTNCKITVKKDSDKGNTKDRDRKSGQAITIDGSSNTFADTLKKIKEVVKDEDQLQRIKKVQRTAKGDLMIKIEREAKPIKDQIEEALQGQKIRTVGEAKQKTLQIRDIDETCEEEEIRNILNARCQIQAPDNFKIRSLRPTQRGTQMLTITAQEEDAEKLLALGRIKIGLTQCKIEERIEVERCFKCWGYGHKANKCSGEDRTDLCRRCSGKGHKIEKGENEASCPLCNEKGHTPGSGQCKSFRKAITEERKSLKKRNSTSYN